MSKFERLLDTLTAHGCKVFRRGPTRAAALCPLHRDRRPSLALDQRGNTILMHCFAGCQTRAVLEALGLTWPDLHDGPLPARPAATPEQVEATYDYCTIDGQLYARKVRMVPKAFIWERPAHSGTPRRWRKGLNGLKPGLYGLEDLPEMKQVIVVEGEKARRHLCDLGVVAAAPPCGAAHWSVGWTECLWRVGAFEVVILPDADKPGRDHGIRVATSCYHWRPSFPLAAPDDPWPDVALQSDDPEAQPLTVKLVTLPGLQRGEDVYDWLTTYGHTKRELLALIAATPLWTPPDPLARRRELTRKRVAAFRKRERERQQAIQAQAGQAPPEGVTREEPVTRERSDHGADSPSQTATFRDLISRCVTRYSEAEPLR